MRTRLPLPRQAGKSQALYLMRALSGFRVTPAPESGDKLTRFGPFSSPCRAGSVKIRRGSWNEELFRVLEGFPDLAHDDEVDAPKRPSKQDVVIAMPRQPEGVTLDEVTSVTGWQMSCGDEN